MNKKLKYISLKEAARFCPYSPDYLKLRARQKKLKALKIGRNWVTTEKWIKEYVDEFNRQTILAPYNLPVVDEAEVRRYLPEIKPLFFSLNFQKGIVLITIFILIFSWINFKIGSFENEIIQLNEMKISFQKMIKEIQEAKNGLSKNNLTAVLIAGWSELKNQFLQIEKSLRKAKEIVFQISRKAAKIVFQKIDYSSQVLIELKNKIIVPEISKKGLVVIPFIADKESALEKIKKSFSDEVLIEPDETGQSGIIKPVFKKEKEQKYLYLLVPINEEK